MENIIFQKIRLAPFDFSSTSFDTFFVISVFHFKIFFCCCRLGIFYFMSSFFYFRACTWWFSFISLLVSTFGLINVFTLFPSLSPCYSFITGMLRSMESLDFLGLISYLGAFSKKIINSFSHRFLHHQCFSFDLWFDIMGNMLKGQLCI